MPSKCVTCGQDVKTPKKHGLDVRCTDSALSVAALQSLNIHPDSEVEVFVRIRRWDDKDTRLPTVAELGKYAVIPLGLWMERVNENEG